MYDEKFYIISIFVEIFLRKTYIFQEYRFDKLKFNNFIMISNYKSKLDVKIKYQIYQLLPIKDASHNIQFSLQFNYFIPSSLNLAQRGILIQF